MFWEMTHYNVTWHYSTFNGYILWNIYLSYNISFVVYCTSKIPWEYTKNLKEIHELYKSLQEAQVFWILERTCVNTERRTGWKRIRGKVLEEGGSVVILYLFCTRETRTVQGIREGDLHVSCIREDLFVSPWIRKFSQNILIYFQALRNHCNVGWVLKVTGYDES